MQKYILLLVSTVFIPFILLGHDGSKSIYLSGKLKDTSINKISIHELEKPFNLIEAKIFNPYEKRSDQYKGILLDKLVSHFAGKDVTSIKFTAIDDYEATIYKEQWATKRILLSTQVNGKYIPVTNKGPMRVVYPDYDPSDESYKETLPTWLWLITDIEFK